jgi:hypothetical protein
MTGLGNLPNVPDDRLPSDQFRSFKRYIAQNQGRFSLWDGGCMMYNVSPCVVRDAAYDVWASTDVVVLAHIDSRTRTGHGKVDRIRLTSSQRLSMPFGGPAADLLQRPLWSLHGITERHPSSARRCHPGGCRSTLRQRRWLHGHSQRFHPGLSRTVRTTAQGEI